jgi:hypothetical protein
VAARGNHDNGFTNAGILGKYDKEVLKLTPAEEEIVTRELQKALDKAMAPKT